MVTMAYPNLHEALVARGCKKERDLAMLGFQECGRCGGVFDENDLRYDAWPPLCKNCWTEVMKTVSRGKRK